MFPDFGFVFMLTLYSLFCKLSRLKLQICDNFEWFLYFSCKFYIVAGDFAIVFVQNVNKKYRSLSI